MIHKPSFIKYILLVQYPYSNKESFNGRVIQFLWAKAVESSSQHLRSINKPSPIKTNLGTSLRHTGTLELFYLDSENI